ncbi:hypothetical protein NQ318_011405 [Aromia moschata]|uniref:DUF4817 domain-containing protein n=1 Tax=Aromia moschata TaxID=1265417 RepID=A0AAV8YUV0_9CUCU|nr:hypothetical protein NQ318_011405 [Aromia moschata]
MVRIGSARVASWVESHVAVAMGDADDDRPVAFLSILTMPNFTNQELTDIVLCYGASGNNALQAQRRYQQMFPNRQVPDVRRFVSTVQRLRYYGSFAPRVHDRGRTRSRRVMDAEEQILEAVEDDPSLSTKRLAHQVRFSQFTVWRTLREQGLYPYHVQKVQALQPGDEFQRMQFCEWLLEKCNNQPNFLRYVLFTDEAGFTKTGVFNMHNTHVWCDENPHAYRNFRDQRNFSVNVWCGIVGDVLLGPHILPDRLTGNGYLNFLQHVLPNLLEEVPLGILRQMWYFHDGAPPHFARQVRDFLNVEYPNRWIGRNGPIHWPARSPDLTPCDFYYYSRRSNCLWSSSGFPRT